MKLHRERFHDLHDHDYKVTKSVIHIPYLFIGELHYFSCPFVHYYLFIICLLLLYIIICLLFIIICLLYSLRPICSAPIDVVYVHLFCCEYYFVMSGYVLNEVLYITQTTALLTANFPGSLMVLELTNPILRYSEFCRLLGSRYRCFWCYRTTHTFLPSCLSYPMSHTPGYWSPDSRYFPKFYFQTELWSGITIRADLFSLRKERK